VALDKPTLINDIRALFETEATKEDHPEDSRDRLALGLADAIEKYVKSGDGKHQAGTLQAGATAVTPVGGSPTVIKLT
jgi:hypothetical protein